MTRICKRKANIQFKKSMINKFWGWFLARIQVRNSLTTNPIVQPKMAIK